MGLLDESIKTIVANSPIGMHVTQDGRIKLANAQFQNLLGYSEADLLNMNFLDLILPLDSNMVEGNITNVLNGVSSQTYECRYIRKSGETCWILEALAPVRFDSKPGALGYLFDITDQKRTEQRGKQLNLLLHTIIDIHRLIAKEKDVGYLIKGVCHSFVRTRGYWNAWIALIDDSYKLKSCSAYRMHKSLSLMLEGWEGGNLPKCVVAALSQAGAVIIADPLSVCAGCALYTDECAMVFCLKHMDKVYGFLTIATTKDLITHPDERTLVEELGEDLAFALYRIELEEKQHQVEKALLESSDFNSKLLSNSPTPVLVVNPDTTITYVNPALEKLTGFSYSELVGRKAPYPWWLEDNRDEDSKELKRAMRYGTTDIEEFYQSKKGVRFWVEVDCVPLKSDGKLKFCVFNWVDVTEQRRRREDLQFYIAEIIRAQEEERKRIAREIHDDTAQTIAGACADCNNIILTQKGLSDEAAKLLERLHIKLKGILVDVRQLSHNLRPGLLDQFGLIPSLELLINDVNVKGGTDCRLEVLSSERRIIPEVEVALFRIVQEALRNVVKHSKAKKAIVSIRFDKQRVRVCIEDNGIGFELPTALNALARRGKLGLMGMRERARLVGGNLRVESQLDKGSLITVTIPL